MKRVIAVGLLVASCGGPAPAGSGSVTGADGFKVVSALSNWQQGADGGLSFGEFFLTDVATNCADMAHRSGPPFSRSIFVGSVSTEGTLGPATVEVDGGAGAAGTALVQHTGGASDVATSGTLDITAIDATHVAGTVSVTIAGGTLNAAFDAPVCAALPL